MLPLGVVIPTKNSMAYLPRHVEGLSSWLAMAAEVVVVDSHSTDGTVEFLRANLQHPALRFTNHPPGLYASWNHGIAQIQSKYVFIATTGDTITRDGVCKLVAAAESLECDVVISKPGFCDKSGRVLPDISWPIDDIVSTLGITAPRKLHALEAVVFAVVHATGAITGSCASCLFRAATLKRFPFPTNFGTTGDGAWGLQHAAEVCWGVVPEKFSNFVVHATNASLAEKQFSLMARRGDAVLRAGMESWRRSGVISDRDLACARWDDLIAGLTSYLDAKTAFDQNRRNAVPWILNPSAWWNRLKRGCSAKRLEKLKHEALRRCHAMEARMSC